MDQITVFKQTVAALAQGKLPEFMPEQREDVGRAFDTLREVLKENIFQSHLRNRQWSAYEWLSWINEGLAKYSNGTVSLRLVDSESALFLLTKNGEEQHLVLQPSTEPQPFAFVSPDAKGIWPEW